MDLRSQVLTCEYAFLADLGPGPDSIILHHLQAHPPQFRSLRRITMFLACHREIRGHIVLLGSPRSL